MFQIIFNKKVLKEDLVKIHRQQRVLIRNILTKKLKKDPYLYGKPLRQSLRGARSLRIGNYRVVYQIQDKKVRVHVVAIGKRSNIYEIAKTRL